jgi:hypothetical protein
MYMKYIEAHRLMYVIKINGFCVWKISSYWLLINVA